jgi:hypothetical protein
VTCTQPSGVAKQPVVLQAGLERGCLLRSRPQQELVGSLHLHRVFVFDVGHDQGSSHRDQATSSPPYGSVLTFFGGDTEGRERGFLRRKCRDTLRVNLMPNAIRLRTLT